MSCDADEVVEFWFAGSAAERAERWFGADAAVDRACRERFGPCIERALRGELDAWSETPRGTLALLVLLDQMTRNAFRGTPRAFAGDAKALELSDALRASGADRSLSLEERYVALLPTQHAEDVAVQRRGVEAYRALVADAEAAGDENRIGVMRAGLDYAQRHLVIIERFKRFPHRNEILGRTSTAEEIAFLEQPGSRF